MLRAGILTALAILLVWQVVSRSLVAYLANAAPEAALKLRPDDPRALLKLAERHFQGHAPNAGPPGSDGRLVPVSPEVQQWAELALAGDPLNAGALSLLGQLADRQGDQSRAERIMQAAARASVHEIVAAFWPTFE